MLAAARRHAQAGAAAGPRHRPPSRRAPPRAHHAASGIRSLAPLRRRGHPGVGSRQAEGATARPDACGSIDTAGSIGQPIGGSSTPVARADASSGLDGDGDEQRRRDEMGAAPGGRHAAACVRPDRADRGLGRLRPHRQQPDRPAGRQQLMHVAWWIGLSAAATVVLIGIDRADPPAAPVRRAAQDRARLPGRGALALPHGARIGHDRGPRGASRTRPRRRRERYAGRGRGAPARLRRRAQPARPHHARPLRARARLFADDREGAPSQPRRGRPAQLGGAPARRRQARGADGDPQQGRPADGRGVAVHPQPPRARGAPGRAAAAPGSESGRTRSPTTTSAGTARATRAAARATTSRSPAASSRSPTCST